MTAPDPLQAALDLRPRRYLPDVRNETVGSPRYRPENPDTSKKAAAGAADTAPAQRLMILGALKVLGREGANASELDQRFGWPAGTAGRRMIDLAAPKHGPPLAVLTLRERPTASGRAGGIYVAAEYA